MDVAALRELLSDQARFFRETVEAQANANQITMNNLQQQQAQQQEAMLIIMKGLQGDMNAAAESRTLAKEKEGLTTKRAFTMLPHYHGKSEEFDSWKFQMTQFLAEDQFFIQFLEWIENDLPGENDHASAVQELDN